MSEGPSVFPQTPGGSADAENSVIDEYQVPERIQEPSTTAAVANVEPVEGASLASVGTTALIPDRILEPTTIAATANVEPVGATTLASTGTDAIIARDVDVVMPGALPEEDVRFYDSDEEEPTVSDALKTAAHSAQETLGSVVGTVSSLLSSVRRKSINATRSVAPADAASAGATTGSVVGTVAGTVHAVSDVVAEAVRPYLPHKAPAAPVDHEVHTPLPPPVTASEPAQPTLGEKVQSVAGTTRDLAASAYQTAAEKAQVAGAVAGDLASTAAEKASGVAAVTTEKANVVYDSAANEALNARAAAQVSANQSYEQSAQKTEAVLDLLKDKASTALNYVEGAVGVAVVKAAEVASAVQHGAEATLHKAAEASNSAYTQAATTATAAKDRVVGAGAAAYDTAATTTQAAKERALGATSAAYGATASTVGAAKDSVVGTAAATRDAIVGAGSAAYNTTASTVGAAKDSVVGTAAATRDAVAGAGSAAYNATASTVGSAKESVVNTANTAYETVAGKATEAKERALPATEATGPGIIETAQQKLAATAAAVSSGVSNTTSSVTNSASNLASTVASAPSAALNYIRGVPAEGEAADVQPSGLVPATGAFVPEYTQGVGAPAEELPKEYSTEEIKDAEEAERARRDRPGETARQAFEHARQEAAAFSSGMREHLGESASIPALAVPRRELIREAEEAERSERTEAQNVQRGLAEQQARLFSEGLKDAAGTDHLHSAIDVARSAQISSAEESEREARVKSLEPAAALAVAAAVREGLSADDSAAVGVARREVTRDAEEQARQEKLNTEAGERSIAKDLASAFEKGIADTQSDAADVARLERIKDAEEQERAERMQDWKAEGLAHEQARIVSSGLDSVDLRHVSDGQQVKDLIDAEEQERDRRIREATEEGHKSEVAPAVAAAVVEGLQKSHEVGGITNPAIGIANREIEKDQEEQERQERIDSGDVLRNAGAPTQSAFAVRSGLLHESNPATAVARKIADSEGVQEPLPSVAGRGITPSTSNALPSPTKTAFDTIKSDVSQPSPTSIPITDFGTNPSSKLLGAEPLAVPAPATPERADSIAATQGSIVTEDNEAARAIDSDEKKPSQEEDVGLQKLRPSPSDVVRESDIVDDLAPYQEDKDSLRVPEKGESQATLGERSVSPESRESRKSTSSIDSNGNKKPKKIHGLYQKAIGKIELGIGKITHSEHLKERGEELHAAGAAEIAQARERAAK
ncbi:hypothetical protein HDV00_005784 [Rhizophlyctis rosea]|nr:hypothetical protein HDV00_005784 [Rhizophlyctis rosea]